MPDPLHTAQGVFQTLRSVADQLAQLQTRGMQIGDVAKATDYLERIGYYRLSGYWYDFRVRGEPFCPLDAETGRKPQKVQVERPVLDAFKPGTRFHDAVDWYVFDKKLRLLALDCIEVALRVDLSRRLGEKDPFSYLNKKTNM